jgi:hypothetical protein
MPPTLTKSCIPVVEAGLTNAVDKHFFLFKGLLFLSKPVVEHLESLPTNAEDT